MPIRYRKEVITRKLCDYVEKAKLYAHIDDSNFGLNYACFMGVLCENVLMYKLFSR